MFFISGVNDPTCADFLAESYMTGLGDLVLALIVPLSKRVYQRRELDLDV